MGKTAALNENGECRALALVTGSQHGGHAASLSDSAYGQLNDALFLFDAARLASHPFVDEIQEGFVEAGEVGFEFLNLGSSKRSASSDS